MTTDRPDGGTPRRVLVLGATGTIGRASVRALVSRGHEVVCLVRRPAGTALPTGATERIVDLTDPSSLAADGLRGEPFDVLVSCLASRTGLPDDAWAIDYRAQVSALQASRAAGVRHVVLLSAICVQKPVLAFQHAKLAFEAELIASGVKQRGILTPDRRPKLTPRMLGARRPWSARRSGSGWRSRAEQGSSWRVVRSDLRRGS